MLDVHRAAEIHADESVQVQDLVELFITKNCFIFSLSSQIKSSGSDSFSGGSKKSTLG